MELTVRGCLYGDSCVRQKNHSFNLPTVERVKHNAAHMTDSSRLLWSEEDPEDEFIND